MKQPNKTKVSIRKLEDKDYLYVNMWLFLALPAVILFNVANIFPQLLETQTFLILTLVGIAVVAGCSESINLAIKPGAKPSRIAAWFVFSLSVLSVVVGIIAMYTDLKIIAALSLFMTIPISFFSILSMYYDGDHQTEEKPGLPHKN